MWVKWLSFEEQLSGLGDDTEEDFDDRNPFDLVSEIAIDYEDEGESIDAELLAQSVALLSGCEESEAEAFVQMNVTMGMLRLEGTRIVVTDLGYEIAGRTRAV